LHLSSWYRRARDLSPTTRLTGRTGGARAAARPRARPGPGPPAGQPRARGPAPGGRRPGPSLTRGRRRESLPRAHIHKHTVPYVCDMRRMRAQSKDKANSTKSYKTRSRLARGSHRRLYTYPTATRTHAPRPRTRSALWGRARACPQVPRKTCTLCSACSRGEALALLAGPPVLGRAVIEQLHHLLGSK